MTRHEGYEILNALRVLIRAKIIPAKAAIKILKRLLQTTTCDMLMVDIYEELEEFKGII